MESTGLHQSPPDSAGMTGVWQEWGGTAKHCRVQLISAFFKSIVGTLFDGCIFNTWWGLFLTSAYYNAEFI